ncbi:hypothetical protein T4E_7606 [Trichinella pseudospiralis]|uniref:Uncharacterized protein n=1 Tax=Trichinella pseudospiralis TaxID=6337 RepID=A0A0V0XDR8_TRIPS|nr:hypothetical protein T4E_7606 [Trichinella pseudospiralis]
MQDKIQQITKNLPDIASDVHRRSRLILFANRVNAVPDVHCQRLYQMHNEDELVIGNEVCRGIGGNVICFVLMVTSRIG